METDRLMQLLALKDEYDRMGLYSPDNYSSAGFTPEELAQSGLFDAPPPAAPRFMNRADAYRLAQLPEEPQRGRGYGELFLDNLIGLPNDYDSTVEDIADVYNQDKIGFLKNAGAGVLEGAWQTVSHPIDTVSGVARDLYESGANVAKVFDPDQTYLDDILREQYGVGYDEATDDQISKARETLLGDIFNVASVIPVGKAVKTAADAAEGAVDAAQLAQRAAFDARNAPAFPASGFEGGRYYVPSLKEAADINVALGSNTPLPPTHQGYVTARRLADELAAQGVPDRVIAEQTGILRVPMVDKQGNRIGTRPVAVMNDAEFADLRPVQHKDWTVDYVGDLPENVAGAAIPGTKTVLINKNLPADMQGRTKDHEFTHVDFHDSGIDQLGSGSDTDNFADRSGLPRNMTALEMYSANPGEMIARLAEGVEPTMVRRLTAAEVLNPYINTDVSLPRRVAQAARTTMFSETRPPIFGPAFAFPYDLHVGVPMDLAKAQMYDFTVPKHPLDFRSVDDMRDYLNMERKIRP